MLVSFAVTRRRLGPRPSDRPLLFRQLWISVHSTSETDREQPVNKDALRGHLILFVAVTAGTVCTTLTLAYLSISTFFVQDVLYNDVPSQAVREDIPSEKVIETAIGELPAFRDEYPIPVETCDGAILEIQYGSDSTRVELGEHLNENGESMGWWWHSVPVTLRNV